MHTFAVKPKPSQQGTSTKATVPARSHLEYSDEVNSTLQLQRTPANQALPRFLRGVPDEHNAILPRTNSPHLGHDFGRVPARPPIAGGIKTKLAINSPGDEYEQEADHVAEQAMKMPEPKPQSACACGGGCPKCKVQQLSQDAARVQTRSSGSTKTEQNSAPPIIQDVLQSPGRPLESATRADIEPRLGHDFGEVRVHTDNKAAMSALAINALAYTAGQHVVFGANQYSPSTANGRRLLAHELTHVVQQAGSHMVRQARPGIVQRQETDAEPPPDHLDRFHADPGAILRAINPHAYCRMNCPATADAFENFVRTGHVDLAHCDRDAEFRGTSGYQIEGSLSRAFRITPDEHGRTRQLDRFVHLMKSRMPDHGDVVVVEAERTEAQQVGRSGGHLSQYHYFVLVNIQETWFIMDAYLRAVRPLAEFRDYLDELNVTYLRYVRGEFRATPLTGDAIR